MTCSNVLFVAVFLLICGVALFGALNGGKTK